MVSCYQYANHYSRCPAY